MLSFCPAGTIVMLKKCSGYGLFCLARHLGRAISLLMMVSSHLLLTSTGPRGVVGLCEARKKSLEGCVSADEAQARTTRAGQNPAGPGCIGLIML